MELVSRRGVLAAAGTVATAAGAANAASFGNPDEPPQGQINTTDNPSSFTVITSSGFPAPNATAARACIPDLPVDPLYRSACLDAVAWMNGAPRIRSGAG